MHVMEIPGVNDWQKTYSQLEQDEIVTALEQGKVIYFPQLAFQLLDHEHSFLSPHYVAPKAKNISFDARIDRVKGMQAEMNEHEKIKAMMTRFHRQASLLIERLFPSYLSALQQARTSFRPVEISDRKTSYRKDDKRLHVDAFPANPNQGRRILRVFSNVNPDKDRVWRLGESFEQVAKRFLPKVKPALPGSAYLLHLTKLTKSYRTAYDHIMLNIHDMMKKDEIYQKTANQIEFRFAPGTTWVVQTDHVSHAAMSGQYLFEQTFYLPVSAMQNPALSPLKVLENLTARPLV